MPTFAERLNEALEYRNMTFNQGVRSSNLRWITKKKALKSLCINGFKAFFHFYFNALKMKSVVTP